MATHTPSPAITRLPRTRFPALRRKTESALLLSRNFDASQRRVYHALIEPSLLKRWWAPNGWSTPYVSVDPRQGGLFHYAMRSPHGELIWGRGIIRDLQPPRRIVYLDSFADEEGNQVDPATYAMSSDHPLESRVTITLSKIKGGTRLTLRHDLPRFFSGREMMQQGWNEMLERLAALLAETAMSVTLGERETIFTRLFAVSRETLFDAWLDQELLAEWWGPHDFTNPVCISDPKDGGHFRIVMRSPEGIDQSVSGEYLEIDAPQRLVFTNLIDDAPAEFLEQLNKLHHGARYISFPTLTNTLLFEAQGEMTRLTLHTHFASNNERDAFVSLGYPEGMAESLEKLEALFGSCSLPG